MSSSGETAPPRRVWPRAVGWSCLAVVIVGAVGIFGSICYLYVSQGAVSRKANEQNLAAASVIPVALEAHRRTYGRYPKSLCDLRLNQRPRLAAVTQLLYTPAENGAEYWLAIFPWRGATIVMPSDDALEYSSATRKWTEMDVSETKASRDEEWVNGCRADTMTNTR